MILVLSQAAQLETAACDEKLAENEFEHRKDESNHEKACGNLA